MDGAALAAGVVERWEQLTAVDELLDAVERSNVPHVRTLCGDATIRAALAVGTWTRLEVLSCMAEVDARSLRKRQLPLSERNRNF